MKKSTLLRIVGAVLLLVCLGFIGRYDVRGYGPFLFIVGFAVLYERLIVKPVREVEKAERLG